MNTTTIDVLLALAALATGGGVGLIYFGGLWRTVQAMSGASRPTLLFVGSFIARNLLLAAAAVAMAMVAEWYHLTIFLVGLIAVRSIMVRGKREVA